MNVIVCGGRDYRDRDAAFRALDAFAAVHPIWLLVHGGARGADSIAGEWAKARGIRVKEMPADWNAHGRKAGPLRNVDMLDGLLRSDAPSVAVLAFKGGRGTAHMTGIAARAGVRVFKAINGEWIG